MEQRYIRSIRLREPVESATYLSRLPVVQHLAALPELPFDRDVTFLVGENGSGKSTLLEAIAIAYGFNAEGGSRNFRFSTNATHSPLHRHLTVVRSAYPTDGFFLRAESFYNLATHIDDIEVTHNYDEVSLHARSHGESFLSLVLNRFRGNGLYLLDEPESALSPSRQLALLAAIHDLVGQHSQFIIATHSPILMAYPDARIYALSEQGVQPVDYRQTEHYQLTRRFLEDPSRMLREVLADSD